LEAKTQQLLRSVASLVDALSPLLSKLPMPISRESRRDTLRKSRRLRMRERRKNRKPSMTRRRQ
jgi:hypothetical protein